MLKINCLLQDTSLKEDIKTLIHYYAADKIANGEKANFLEIYHNLRKNGVEVDLETTASLYQDMFDLTDSNYTSTKNLYAQSGRIFADNLDKMQNTVTSKYLKTGARSPAQAVADALTHLFIADHTVSSIAHSPMLKMQDALKKAAMAQLTRAKKPVNPHEPLDKMLERILNQADQGVSRLDGQMNTMGDIVKDFKNELKHYTNSLPITERATWETYINDAEKAMYNVFLSNKEADSIVKNALINAGYGKTTPSGVQLDWAKLAGGVKSLDDIKRNVINSLTDMVGAANAERISSSLISRYNVLLSRSVAHNLGQLNRGNALKKAPAQSDVKRLMRYYNYGLFDTANEGLYDNLMNKVVGFDSTDAKAMAEMRIALAEIQTAWNIFGNTDRFMTVASDHISRLLIEHGGKHGSAAEKFAYKIARFLWNWVSDYNKSILYNLHNVAQNYVGNEIALINRKLIGDLRSGEITGSIQTIDSVAKAYFKEVGKGASMYGGGAHHFLQPGGILEAQLEKIGLKGSLIGVLTGRYMLDGMDSYTKYLLTQQNIIYNTRKVLMERHGKSRTEANRIITEQLFGVKFEDAKKQAKDLIAKSNGLLKDSENNILIVADDLIKANLVTSGALTENEWESVRKSAFTSAGLQIGHEGLNSPIGATLSVSGHIAKAIGKGFREDIEFAIKHKRTGSAATLLVLDIFINKIGLKFASGAANWVVIAAKRTGLGMISKMSGDYRTDLNHVSDEDLERKLYNHMRVKNDFITGAMGALATVSFFLATAVPFGDDDEPLINIYDWVEREENKWAKKYIDVFAPVTFMMWMEFKKGGGFDGDIEAGLQQLWDKQLKRMLSRGQNTMGFDADFFQYDRKFDFETGMLQEFDKLRMVRAFANEFLQFPVGAWRVMRDLYKDVTIPLSNTAFNTEIERRGTQNFKLENWVEAAFWNGIVWELGLENDLVDYMRDKDLITDNLEIMGGVGPKDIDLLKERGITTPDDLRSEVHRGESYKVIVDGKNKTIMTEEDVDKFIDDYNSRH